MFTNRVKQISFAVQKSPPNLWNCTSQLEHNFGLALSMYLKISFKSDTLSSCLQGAGSCLELRDKPASTGAVNFSIALFHYKHAFGIDKYCCSNRTSLNWRKCHQSFVMESAQKLGRNEKICEDVHFNKKLHLFVSLTIPRHYSYKNYNWVLVIITS